MKDPMERLDRVMNAQQQNPKGFRTPAHGKRSKAKKPKPTLAEKLSKRAFEGNQDE